MVLEILITALCAMIFLHFLLDYPLQGDFLSKAKNRSNPIPHVPWYQALFAHSFLQAGAVYLVLGVWWIALLELAVHAWVDDRKCAGELTFNADQAIHIGVKFIWVALFLVYAMLSTAPVKWGPVMVALI